jgi:hypothetical protein
VANPYPLGTGYSAAVSNQLTFTTTADSPAGDQKIIGAGASGTDTVTGVSDGTSNTYQQVNTAGAQVLSSIWVTVGATVDVPSGSTITVTYNTSNNNGKTAVMGGYNGYGGYSSLDVAPAYQSSSGGTTPLIASGTLTEPAEVIFILFGNGNGGGSPNFSSGNCASLGTASGGVTEYLSLAYAVVTSTAPVNYSCTITSAKWSATLASFGQSGSAQLYPLQNPVGPGRWPRLRKGSMRGSPAPPPVQFPSRLYPMQGPVSPQFPPKFRPGRMRGSAGAPVTQAPSAPAPVYPRQRPMGPRLLPRFRKGSMAGRAGAPVTQFPSPLYPPQGPVAPQYPPRWRGGRMQASHAAAVTQAPSVPARLYPMGGPVAPQPSPFRWRKGSMQGHGGAPVTQFPSKAIPQQGPASPQFPPRFRKGSMQGGRGAPVYVAPITPVVCGSGGYAPPLTGGVPLPPGAQSLQIPVTNVTGDWMIALLTWRQTEANEGITCMVGDDVHNFWDPLGAPVANSSAEGVTVCSIWVAPAAKAAGYVLVAPSGVDVAICATILDVPGLSPWLDLASQVSAYVSNGTTISLPLAAPPSQALQITICGTDNLADTISWSGAGWSALPSVTASNGTDHTSDLQLSAQWHLTTGSTSAHWSSSGALDMSGITATILVTAAQPAQVNPDWPVLVAEVAPGSGPASHPDAMTWVPVTARSLALSVTQGRPYLPGTLQAGEGAVTFDAPDQEMVPPGSGAYAGIDSGCPFRIRTIWPASETPYGVPFSGYLLTYPQAYDPDMLRGSITSKVTDLWGYANAQPQPILLAELLNEGDALYACWPCTDAPGAPAAANYAPGNSNPLYVTRSKYGAGNATESFGQNPQAILGAQGSLILTSSVRSQSQSGMWGQALGTGTSPGQGYGLQCADPDYPPISGGVTVECWEDIPSATITPWVLLLSGVSQVPFVQFEMISPSTLTFTYIPAGSTTGHTQTVSTTVTGLFHLVVQLTTTTYDIWLNGVSTLSGSFSAAIPARFTYLYAASGGLQFSGGGTGYFGFFAVLAGLTHPLRIATHYQAGINGMAGDTAPGRIERLLQAAGSLGRRVILQDTGDGVVQVASCQDIPSQAASASIANIAANTPPGMLAVTPPGELFYLSRSAACNQAARWVLGDDQAAGELPFRLSGFGTDYDPQRVVNGIGLTQLDNLDVIAPSGAAAALEPASEAQYGWQTYQVTGYLQGDLTEPLTFGPGLYDLANWLAATYAAPRTRIAAVTIDASRYPGAWPFVTQACSGDMITLNLRPPAQPAGTLITVTGRIAQTTRALRYSLDDGAEGSLGVIIDIAPEQDVLTADDPVRGQLNGSNVLAW